MFYKVAEENPMLQRDPFKSVVVPRPIGWISSRDANGILNLAPYSFFNAVSADPHMVMFSSDGRKDSLKNIESTKEFVCNLATIELKEQMNESSASVGSEVSEFELAGLTECPSNLVNVPRVKECLVALECCYLKTVSLPDRNGVNSSYEMVLGEVLGIHIDDSLIAERKINMTKFKPLARLGGFDYSFVDDVFTMVRPT